MLEQRLVYTMVRLLAQLERTSIHLPLLLVHIVLLALQANRALEVQLLQLLVLPVKL